MQEEIRQCSGSAVGRKIKMEEVVEENFNELFGNVPEIEQAAEQDLGMSSGSPEPEQNSYWFTSDHLGSSAFVTDKSGVAIQHLGVHGFRRGLCRSAPHGLRHTV